MSGSPLNGTRYIKKQGLDPQMVFAAIVVDNKDPRFAQRVRVRVPDILPDTIPDNHLPWALPNSQAYAVNEAETNRAGFINVPPIGAKVGVCFPTGDPHRPELRPYPGDKETVMELAKVNYPNRAIMQLENGCMILVDKSTNEIFVTNPGDAHFVFLGDYSKTIVGSCTEIITGSKGDVPAYMTNASNTKVAQLQAKSAGGVSKGAGNKYEKITGDYTLEIGGNRTVKVGGNDTLKVERNRDENIGGNHNIQAARSDTN